MIDADKRKRMETLIYKVFDKLDPTGKNTETYKNAFAAMSDRKFDNFFQALFADKKSFLTLTVVEYERQLKLEYVEAAAKVLKIPLYETVFFPHITMDENAVVSTKKPAPVGYCNIKRVQQTLKKKNGLSVSIDQRSSLTGQVTGGDKNGRESDLENAMLASVGFHAVLQELNGPRADDMHMKQQMYSSINTKGYIKYEDLDCLPENKTTLNTVNTFLLGMGINSDLVTTGLMVKKTLKEEI